MKAEPCSKKPIDYLKQVLGALIQKQQDYVKLANEPTTHFFRRTTERKKENYAGEIFIEVESDRTTLSHWTNW